MVADQPYFDNPKDEASYWKQVAEEYIEKYQELKDEFEDFQEGSRELEAELEAQLEQYEKRVKELVSTRSALEEENESVKEKLGEIQTESYTQITTLQDQNIHLKAAKDELTSYIRGLEQTNDDLERAKRATICSLEEFDCRLNSAIERNAFLENELEEKEELIITVQRLKDEARDLKADLALSSRDRHTSFSESKSLNENTPTKPSSLTSETIKTTVGSNASSTSTMTTSTSKATIKFMNENSPQNTRTTSTGKGLETEKNRTNSLLNSSSTTNSTFSNISNKTNTHSSNPMTPSARISALNIVSDLLRKVGALESKLASCRNFVQDHPRNGRTAIHGVTPITDSPKNKSKSMSISGNGKGSQNISGLVKVNV